MFTFESKERKARRAPTRGVMALAIVGAVVIGPASATRPEIMVTEKTAKHCAVTDVFVGKVRKTLSTNGSEMRTVKRGGTERRLAIRRGRG